MSKRLPRKSRRPLSAWQSSAQWRAISSEAIRAWNASFSAQPRCGAKRRTDGEPCRNLGLENGRCRFHGGRVPKGDGWHRTQWPAGQATDTEAKLQGKLQHLSRREAKRKRRVKAMSADERAAYEKHRRAVAPSSAGERDRRRVDRQTKTWLGKQRPSTAAAETSTATLVAQLEADCQRLESELQQIRTGRWDVFG